MSNKPVLIGIGLLVLGALLLMAAGVWITSSLFGGSVASAPSPYSAVFLSNGDIYFGKLSWFPVPRLTKVWALQVGVDKNNQRQLGVTQFEKAFWGPVDELYLNPKEIVWWSRLRNDSDLAKAIDNPALIQQQQQLLQQQTSLPTSTPVTPPIE